MPKVIQSVDRKSNILNPLIFFLVWVRLLPTLSPPKSCFTTLVQMFNYCSLFRANSPIRYRSAQFIRFFGEEHVIELAELYAVLTAMEFK